MKYKSLIILVVLTTTVFLGCNNSKGFSKEEINFSKDASYALGLNIGADIRMGMTSDNIFPNLDEFLKGMRDGVMDRKPRFDMDEAMAIIEAAFNLMLEQRTAEYNALMEELNADTIEEQNAFLAENSQKPGIVITSSGLQYEIITQGNGPKPAAGSEVEVHYEGTLIDGTVFDSSFLRGIPTAFSLDEVISGWTEGIQLMNTGSTYKFYIPYNLGYGANGMGRIPPFSTLIFTVELLNILN